DPRGVGRAGLPRQAEVSKLTRPHRTRTCDTPTSQINERRQRTANSQSARDRARRHFGLATYSKHHPFGLILPSTTLHAFGCAHGRRRSHACSPFGFSWSCTRACLPLSWARAPPAAAPTMVAATAPCRTARRVGRSAPAESPSVFDVLIVVTSCAARPRGQ